MLASSREHKPKALQSVKVRGAAWDRPDPSFPSTMASLDAKQMRHLNILDPEDALKYFPNLSVRKRFVGDENTTLSVRGTGTSQTARGLVYMDGLLLSNLMGNTHSYPPRWSMVFPDKLSRVEVIYGAYSALYPGNAIGAVVNMTTHMPDHLEMTGNLQVFTQHVDTYRIKRNYSGNRKSASMGDRIGRWSFLLGVSRQVSNGQPLVYATEPLGPVSRQGIPVSGGLIDRGPDNKPRVVMGINSEGQEVTRQNEAKLKLSYDINDTWRAGFDFDSWRQDRTQRTRSFLRDAQGQRIYAGSVNIDGRSYKLDPSYFAPGRRANQDYLYGLSLATHRRYGWNVAALASYFDMAKGQDRTAFSGLPEQTGGQIRYGDGSHWKTLDLRASWRPERVEANTHSASFGYHYDGYSLRSNTYATDIWSGGRPQETISRFGGNTRTQAFYAQDAWQLTQHWQLTYGLRYEIWQAYGGFLGNSTQRLNYFGRRIAHPSPKASLAFQATDNWLLKFSFARAYRFPTVAELFQGSISGNEIIRNNPRLRPENDLSRELSSLWYLPKGMLRVSLYQSNTRDTLFNQTNYLVFPNVTNVQNIGLVRTRGAEVSYQGEGVGVSWLDISASAAYTQATTVHDDQNPAAVGKQFYRIPRWRANLVATLHASPAAAITLAGRYSSRLYNTLDHSDLRGNTFGGSSGYVVWDAKLLYRPIFHWQFSVGVDNITNRRYYIYYPYPSRSYMAEVKWTL